MRSQVYWIVELKSLKYIQTKFFDQVFQTSMLWFGLYVMRVQFNVRESTTLKKCTSDLGNFWRQKTIWEVPCVFNGVIKSITTDVYSGGSVNWYTNGDEIFLGFNPGVHPFPRGKCIYTRIWTVSNIVSLNFDSIPIESYVLIKLLRICS